MVSKFPQSVDPWQPSENYSPPKIAMETIPVADPSKKKVQRFPISAEQLKANAQASRVQTADEYYDSGVLIHSIPAPGHNLPRQSNRLSLESFPARDGFGETGCSINIFDENKGEIPLTNFKMRIVGLLQLVTLKGKPQKLVQLRLCSIKHQADLEVSVSDFHRLGSILSKTHPEFHVFASNAKGDQLFRDYLAKSYEMALSTLTWETVYQVAGWYELYPGEWRYVSGSNENCRSERLFPDIRQANMVSLCQSAFGLFQIADLDTMLPLFLEAHIDALLCPFEVAGHPVQHMLVIVGPTNSKKTSLAKVLFCHFDMRDVINFTATERAIELRVEKAHDSIMVLDDLSSVKDRNMMAKLDFLLRQVGNSTGREKSVNAGKETERVDTRCAVVLTAESEPDGIQQSAKLRLLTVPVSRNTFNGGILRQYQQTLTQTRLRHEFSYWENYKAGFIRFIEVHFPEIISMIADYMPDARFRFPRQAESFMHFVIIARLVLWFFSASGMMSKEDAQQIFRKQWEPCIYRWIKANESRCAEDDPVLLFLAALANGIARQQLLIAPTRTDFIKSCGSAVGFWDDRSYLAILPEAAYDYATSYFMKLGRGFSATLKDIVATLYAKGMSEGYEQKGRKGKPLKKIKVNGQNLSILYLRWDEAQKQVEAIPGQFETYNEEDYLWCASSVQSV